MYTLHEAKRRGYIPGAHPLSAEEYMATMDRIEAVDARWKAKLELAKGDGLIVLLQMHDEHIAERREYERRLLLD